ncbi:hypothetical protein G6F64_015595 [Rhizopus arrhizus]|uniref:Uncharacterized protein n=1 Tax=Rhizopus oryzae TaxID=64495 RepID=A0A9P6WQX6_RHIOR|nr:hypothetical protein G6F64_015595 [Rhizopus arrhizus]
MPLESSSAWSSRTSWKWGSSCLCWSQPGLKVSRLPSNMPWNSPITVPLLRNTSQFCAGSPPVTEKPSAS